MIESEREFLEECARCWQSLAREEFIFQETIAGNPLMQRFHQRTCAHYNETARHFLFKLLGD